MCVCVCVCVFVCVCTHKYSKIYAYHINREFNQVSLFRFQSVG